MSKLKKPEIAYHPESFLPLEEIKQLSNDYLLNIYDRLDIAFRYGSGSYLYDTNGDEYIDCLSGIAVTALGHAHADLLQTLRMQAEMLWHTSNMFYNQHQGLLGRSLIELSFPGKIFFCNTGTEANEAAIKLMRKWGQDKNKNKIIALKESFHGRTIGSMSLTGQEKIRGGFGDLLSEIQLISANDVDELVAVMGKDVAGILLEPILGESGIISLSDEFLSLARELSSDYEAILAFDEIQTGIGRCGTYFAYQTTNVVPDVITLAKGLGGGFPVGAMIISEQYENVLGSGMHGTTFGGNHLAMAVAYEVIRTIESQKILENVNSISSYLMDGLQKMQKEYPSVIKEVRGKGLLIGVALTEKFNNTEILKKSLQEKLVIGRAANNTIRLLPALNIKKELGAKILHRLNKIFSML